MTPQAAACSALLALALLLGGCAGSTARMPQDWKSHVEKVSAQGSWELQGKIGLRAPGNSGSALLSWRQHGADYHLVLSGALGLGKLVLAGDPEGVNWTGRDGQPRRHPDPQALIHEIWGWEVPVASLPFWVRGLPDPAQPLRDPVIESGLAASFRQAGWVVEPQVYRAVDGIDLPTRVRLRGANAVLTISISHWGFEAP